MLKELKEIIEEACPGVDIREINESTRLGRDLGIDSLGMVMLTVEIEKKYNIKLDNFPYIRTVGDLSDFIENNLPVKENNRA